MAYLGVAPEPVPAAVLRGAAGAGTGSAAEQLAAAVRFALGESARGAAAGLAQVCTLPVKEHAPPKPSCPFQLLNAASFQQSMPVPNLQRARAEVNVPATVSSLMELLDKGSQPGAQGFAPSVCARATVLLRPSAAWLDGQEKRRAPASGSVRSVTASAGEEHALKRARAAPAPRSASPDAGSGGVIFAECGGDLTGGGDAFPALLISAPGLPFSPAVVTSAEEAAYLYREIFSANLYFRCGIHLSGASAFVVDVGANVGLFALRCAADFAQQRRKAGSGEGQQGGEVIWRRAESNGDGQLLSPGALQGLRLLVRQIAVVMYVAAGARRGRVDTHSISA